jgi:hypothetical protein
MSAVFISSQYSLSPFPSHPLNACLAQCPSVTPPKMPKKCICVCMLFCRSMPMQKNLSLQALNESQRESALLLPVLRSSRMKRVCLPIYPRPNEEVKSDLREGIILTETATAAPSNELSSAYINSTLASAPPLVLTSSSICSWQASLNPG